MMMKDSLLLLISNVLGRGFGAGRGPTNDDEGFSVSADLKCFRKGPTNDDVAFFVSACFKCFRKGVWGWGRGPLMMMKDSLFLLISDVVGKGVCGQGQAH